MRLISNKNELLKIAFSSTVIVNGRDTKSFKSSNASSAKMDMKKMAGIKNKMKTGGSRKSSMQEGQTTIDVSLVDAFIANCDDDDVFIRMVDSYGDKLTSKQCEILRKKSKNTTLLTNINSIADIKIVNAIKAMLLSIITGERLSMLKNFITFLKGYKIKILKKRSFLKQLNILRVELLEGIRRSGKRLSAV
jgi:hypothetical protein